MPCIFTALYADEHHERDSATAVVSLCLRARICSRKIVVLWSLTMSTRHDDDVAADTDMSRSCVGKWRQEERNAWDRKMHDVGRVKAMLAAAGKTLQVCGKYK